MKERFIKFLKDNNIYYRFRSYLTFDTLNDDLDDYLSKVDPEEYLTSFDWNDTDEGWNFWNLLSYKWCKCLEERYDYIITIRSREIKISLLHEDIKKLLRDKYNINIPDVKISRNKI